MDFLKAFENVYNSAAGAVIAIFTLIFGPHWVLFFAFLVFNIADWLTGWHKARKRREESSRVGYKGVVKKLFYWVLIAVAFIVANVFVHLGATIGVDLSILEGIGYFVLASLLVNEVRSIIENLTECGVKVPKVLIKGLAIADKLINKDNETEE